MKKIVFFTFVGSIGFLYGFEVNTHQALTRCAITTECNKNGGTPNLDAFAMNTELNISNDYNQQLFEKYKYKGKNVSYEVYIAEAEDAIKDYKVTTNGDYKGMIEAGVILEDAVYHNASFSGDGRFNNHFYSSQFDSRAWCRVMGLPNLGSSDAVPFADPDNMQTSKTLCMGYGERTDNITWALKDGVNLGNGRVNDYGIHDAFNYFNKSFIGSKNDREKYQAKLFVSLGFMVHLIQDLHSPAHVRDGAHAKGDYLEIYGRYDGGFNLRNGVMNPKNNHNIEKAIKSFNIEKLMLKDNSYTSYQDFFRKEADWVSNNFFSEEHNSFESPDTKTGEGLSINNFLDRDTIFDNYNEHLSKGEVSYVSSYADGTDRFQYIKTDGNTISDRVRGKINSSHKVVALVEKGLFFDFEHMIAPKYGIDYNQLQKGLVEQGSDKTPLADTAINVMPRAVASTQAFINFFFRGQMETSLSDDHTKLVIKNVSEKVGRVHDERLLTFKSGGKFYVYYEENGINKPLHTYTLYGDIAKGKTHRIDIGTIIEDKNLPDGTKITVVYDGNIGDNLGGYDDYGIGMKGLSADVFKFKQIKCENPKMSQLIKSLKELIANPKNCVSFSDIHDSVEPKSIYFSERDCTHYGSRVRYKNTELTTGIYGDNINKYEESSLVIDYFNHYIYHFDEPTEDVYTAGTSYSPRSLPRGGDFDVSFSVSQTKNGEPNGIYNLPKLLTYTYLPSNEHVRSPHYHVTCNSSQSLCGYLKGQQLGQNFIEHNVNNIAPYIFLSTIGSNKVLTVGNTIRALNKYYGEYYGQYIKDDKYPDDWLKKMVDWIENYDCKKISKTNIFYDEKRIEKSDQLKGL
jgi:hypothetical protein